MDGFEPSVESYECLTDGGTSFERASDNAIIVPSDGDLRAAIESAGGETTDSRLGPAFDVVRLSAGTQYEIEEPINVPQGVRVEFNGAKVVVTENVDAFRFGGNTLLEEPIIEVVAEPYESTVLTATDGVTGVRPHPSNPCHITDMVVAAPYGQGTGLLVEDREASGIWGVTATGTIWGTETNIHYKSPVEGSWVNSCTFKGILGKSRIGIRTESHPDSKGMSGHRFDAIYQPEDDLSEWFWDLRNGSINRALATVWDKWAIVDESVWRIGEEAGDHNAFVDAFNGAFRWEDAVENHRRDRNDNVLFNCVEPFGGEPR